MEGKEESIMEESIISGIVISKKTEPLWLLMVIASASWRPDNS
jgi:hypothetical protein